MKRLLLNDGSYAIVDEINYDYLKQWRWYANVTRSTTYAVSNIKFNGKRRSVPMHRLLLGFPTGLEVDHINGNGLDNRLTNIRVATHSQNMQNRRKKKETTSHYLGVSWSRSDKRWVAVIKCDGKRYSLGSFLSEKDAAIAYNRKARILFGFHAKQNEV